MYRLWVFNGRRRKSNQLGRKCKNRHVFTVDSHWLWTLVVRCVIVALRTIYSHPAGHVPACSWGLMTDLCSHVSVYSTWCSVWLWPCVPSIAILLVMFLLAVEDWWLTFVPMCLCTARGAVCDCGCAYHLQHHAGHVPAAVHVRCHWGSALQGKQGKLLTLSLL